jgi:hypothetical protein
MALLPLAYYLERTEALVVQSVLTDAGILAIIGNEDWLRVMPYHTLALGGYRVLVSDLDVNEAIELLRNAEVPVAQQEGERLDVSGDGLDLVLSLFLGFLAGGAPTRVRKRTWSEAPQRAPVHQPTNN